MDHNIIIDTPYIANANKKISDPWLEIQIIFHILFISD
jgi:hypothetical protein